MDYDEKQELISTIKDGLAQYFHGVESYDDLSEYDRISGSYVRGENGSVWFSIENVVDAITQAVENF